MTKLERRFWSKVDIIAEDPEQCWIWRAGTCGKYGVFWSGTRQERAHRVAWMFAHGRELGKWHVLHRCHVPACVNQRHFHLGDHQQTMDELVAAGRQPSVLNKRQVQVVRAAYASGVTQRELATIFGVARRTIGVVVAGETWAHLAWHEGVKTALPDRPDAQPRGERHGRARLMDADIREIKRLLAGGELSHREIARRYGVVKSAITSVSTGRRWAHVTLPERAAQSG